MNHIVVLAHRLVYQRHIPVANYNIHIVVVLHYPVQMIFCVSMLTLSPVCSSSLLSRQYNAAR